MPHETTAHTTFIDKIRTSSAKTRIAAGAAALATTISLANYENFIYQDEGCVVLPNNPRHTPEKNILKALDKLAVSDNYDRGDMRAAIRASEELQVHGEKLRVCASTAPFFDPTGNPFIVLPMKKPEN